MRLMLPLLLLFSVAAVSAAKHDGPAPPRAHQLDESYTFEQYLVHFDKSYDDPDEYERRSGIFADNMKKILRHNEGKMTEAGDVIQGYVMGVNMFTDVESDEVPFGYNKALHPTEGAPRTACGGRGVPTVAADPRRRATGSHIGRGLL